MGRRNPRWTSEGEGGLSVVRSDGEAAHDGNPLPGQGPERQRGSPTVPPEFARRALPPPLPPRASPVARPKTLNQPKPLRVGHTLSSCWNRPPVEGGGRRTEGVGGMVLGEAGWCWDRPCRQPVCVLNAQCDGPIPARGGGAPTKPPLRSGVFEGVREGGGKCGGGEEEDGGREVVTSGE